MLGCHVESSLERGKDGREESGQGAMQSLRGVMTEPATRELRRTPMRTS